jgi:acyl-homoserine lactone acylase PvdQ
MNFSTIKGGAIMNARRVSVFHSVKQLTRSTLVAALALALVAICLPVYPAMAANPRLERMAQRVTIYRGSYGVPHVYGPTDASCVFGYIYAQAEDNFWQIEDSYIRALGRASEVHGESAIVCFLKNMPGLCCRLRRMRLPET